MFPQMKDPIIGIGQHDEWDTRFHGACTGALERKPMKKYEFDEIIQVDTESGGAYVAFPWDLRAESGKGRMKVHAEFDGIPYDGSIVNMGVKNEDGSVCYVIGVLKAIRNRLGKGEGDPLHVVITPAGGDQP